MTSPFWSEFRRIRREIALELWWQDHQHMSPTTLPEDSELKEGGYIKRAHVLAFREMRKHNLPTLKEMYDRRSRKD